MPKLPSTLGCVASACSPQCTATAWPIRDVEPWWLSRKGAARWSSSIAARSAWASAESWACHRHSICAFPIPLDIQALAQRHPGARFVIPHFGAGYLREALMVASLCPNVFLDTSSTNRWMRFEGLTLDDCIPPGAGCSRRRSACLRKRLLLLPQRVGGSSLPGSSAARSNQIGTSTDRGNQDLRREFLTSVSTTAERFPSSAAH